MPKIVGSSLAEHREQVRARLFAALASLMAESGFDAVSLADIAARAGVGRTAVYNHFPDKEALLLAFIEDETSSYVATLEAALDGVDDPEQQLRVYVRQQIRLRRSYHLAPGPDLRSVVSPATLERLRDHAVQVERILRGILAAGVACGRLPVQDLDTVVPLVNACLRARSSRDGAATGEAAVEATEAFVLRAVGAVGVAQPVG
jgi:AcrR family transcriptional regulator